MQYYKQTNDEPELVWTLNTKADVRMWCDNNPLEKLMNRIRHCDNRVEIICIHPQLLESIVTIHNLSNIKIAEMTLQCHKIHTHTHTSPFSYYSNLSHGTSIWRHVDHYVQNNTNMFCSIMRCYIRWPHVRCVRSEAKGNFNIVNIVN